MSLNVADTIIEELEVDNISIESPLYRKLFDSYTELLRRIKKGAEEDNGSNEPPMASAKAGIAATIGDMAATMTDSSNSTGSKEESASEDAAGNETPSQEDEDGRRLAQLVESPDVEVTGFVVEMMMRQESRKPSRIWSRYDDVVVTEEENLAAAVPKAIALYKLEVINNIILSISSQLDGRIGGDEEPDEESLALLAQLKVLTDTRKVICQKYSRIL